MRSFMSLTSILMKRELLIAYIALAAICIIWGTTYLALRIAVLHFPPFLFVTIRQLIAGGVLVAFMLTIGKVKLPGMPYIIRQAIAGFLMISLGNGLVAWAEVHIPSGIAAIICSLMPVMVIVINLTINKGERPTIPIIFGVVLGLIGIIMIFGENMSDLGKPEYILGIVMIFVAVVSWAGASIWLKKHSESSNPFLNAGLQMFFGGVWLAPLSLFFDDLSVIHWSTEAVYSMIYLIIFGS